MSVHAHIYPKGASFWSSCINALIPLRRGDYSETCKLVTVTLDMRLSARSSRTSVMARTVLLMYILVISTNRHIIFIVPSPVVSWHDFNHTILASLGGQDFPDSFILFIFAQCKTQVALFV